MKDSRELIPRRIHYVWLGGKPVPRRLQRCIDSWRRVMPDYELVCWNEERFDIHSLPFVEQTYKAGKWSFASDYIRFYAVYREGGIYLDTDVRAFRPFDRFLQHRAFCGTYRSLNLGNNNAGHDTYELAAEFGAEAGHPWLKRCMDAFAGKDYRLSGEIADIGIGPTIALHALPAIFSGEGVRNGGDTGKLDGRGVGEGSWTGERVVRPLELEEGIVLYPETCFAPVSGRLSLRHTHTVHHFTGSWRTNEGFALRRDVFTPLRRVHRALCRRFWLFDHLHHRRKRVLRGLLRRLRR